MVKEPGQQPDIGGRAGNGRSARDTMAETATAAAEQMQSAATEQIEQQKRAASQSIHAFAQAVRRASDELSKQDQTAAAQLIQQAAGGLEDLSQSLSNRSIGDMVGMARDFGRRNPLALAGGAALLGMALGRVARTASAGNGSHDSHALPDQPSPARASVTGSGAAGDFPATRASTPGAKAPSTPPTPSRPQSTSTSTAPSTPKATTPQKPGSHDGGKTSGGSND